MRVSVPAAETRDLRDRLLEAGRVVFARVGYAAATVDDVLVEAGTSRATFYRYFRNKEDLFAALSKACFRDLDALLDGFAPLGGAPGDVGLLLERFAELNERHSGVIRGWFERHAEASPQLQAEGSRAFGRLVESLARPLRAAGVPSSVDPAVQAALLYLLVQQSYFAVTSRWSRIDPRRLGPTLSTMIERAYLGAPAPPAGTRLRFGDA